MLATRTVPASNTPWHKIRKDVSAVLSQTLRSLFHLQLRCGRARARARAEIVPGCVLGDLGPRLGPGTECQVEGQVSEIMGQAERPGGALGTLPEVTGCAFQRVRRRGAIK